MRNIRCPKCGSLLLYDWGDSYCLMCGSSPHKKEDGKVKNKGGKK